MCLWTLQTTEPTNHTRHLPLSLSALLLRWEHGKCHSPFLFQPGVVPVGPSAGRVAEGWYGPGAVGAAGQPAGLSQCWRIPGCPVSLRPCAGHGGVQPAPPAPQVESVYLRQWLTHALGRVSWCWTGVYLSVIQWCLGSEGCWSPLQLLRSSGKMLLRPKPGIQVSGQSLDCRKNSVTVCCMVCTSAY